MNKVLSVLMLVLLSGCTANPQHVAGDKVTVKSGFYKGCSGIVTGMLKDILGDGCVGRKYVVQDLQCQTIEKSFEFICVSDVD